MCWCVNKFGKKTLDVFDGVNGLTCFSPKGKSLDKFQLVFLQHFTEVSSSIKCWNCFHYPSCRAYRNKKIRRNWRDVIILMPISVLSQLVLFFWLALKFFCFLKCHMPKFLKNAQLCMNCNYAQFSKCNAIHAQLCTCRVNIQRLSIEISK